ncbi:MAG: hypothetical protein RLZZ543_316 [Bacteroidota bacterium]|jgi:hypothetical protein
MRRLFILLCLFAIVFPNYSSNRIDASLDNYHRSQLLKSKAKAAAEYVKQKGMNEQHALLIDLGKHSGLHRFYVWSFEKNAPVDSGLVSHGCGDNPWSSTYTAHNPVFSNVPDSHASSLGRYKVGRRGYSQWGIHVNYQLHGLDASNSKALSREIVLHSWESVTEQRVYPEGTPEGWGCPAVSNGFMQRLDILLKKADKPLLMWVYSN